MNWLARTAWIYENTVPDYPTMRAHGIEGLYVDPRSANAAAVIAGLRANGFLVAGIYVATSWMSGCSPDAFAAAAAQYAHQLVPQAYPLATQQEGAPVMLDLEGVTPAWATAAIRSWRKLRPRQETAYTNAPFQGGNVPTMEIVHADLHVYVQLYYGDMRPADPAAALLELARQGVPPQRLHGFYDGACLPSDARDGCVYTLERIPA